MIRINGLERYLGIFREPNNIEISYFDLAYSHSSISHQYYKIIDAIDLLITKDDTGRFMDHQDQVFLKYKIVSELTPVLQHGSFNQVKAVFDRYADAKTCELAIENPAQDVRHLAIDTLKLLAENEDMIAKELLKQYGNEHK
jgi:hypothetical protein